LALDDTDREILSILRADARTPVAVLAQRLRISRGTVQAACASWKRAG
jgi:DNA-binding Lrp family transcriptional regulator